MASHRLFTLPVAILVFQSFLLGTSEFIIVGVLPDIASDLNIAVTMVGNLVAIFAFVYAPLTPIGAAICSKFQRFRALIALLLVFLAGNVISTFAVNYPMLLLARVVTASVSGVLVAVALTFGPDVTSRENQPRYMSWVFSGFSIASVFGMPMGTWIAGLAGWRTSFVVIDVLTVVMIGVMFVVLPKRSVPSQVGILGQFKLFSDRRIILGVLTVVFGLASSYVWYTYLTPMFTNELHVPAAYVSVALVAFGACCLWSNLYSGKLATRGTGIWPLVGMSKAYALQFVCMLLLPFATANAMLGSVLLVVLGLTIYLQNSPSQVLYSYVAETGYPGCGTLASSLNSTSCNLGIALGSAVGGVAYDAAGLRWFGPVGAVFAALAVLMTVLLKVNDGWRAIRSHDRVHLITNLIGR